MDYRKLTDTEITQLENRGCEAENWETIQVHPDFDPARVCRVIFSGNVRIGALAGSLRVTGGAERRCGLYGSAIHNCTLDDHVLISKVSNLANYDIGEKTLIENVGCLTVEGTSSFGNGTKIEVLNEGGGRTLPIYDCLTAQIAYLLVLYRDRPQMVAKLESMIGDYTKSKESDRGSIGPECRIQNCQSLVNVAVGSHATLSGAMRLEDGTISSCVEDPAHIGEGVFAKHFIILSGASVEESAIVSSCFMGQGVKIGEQFSAKDSAFFANSEGFHGEACSVFAGPYTVSHHKSTLLIAGLFSFYNAGSGTNQSNHMYKLGPVHQGILERGSKTGSFSYLKWACHVGPFSVVVNKHTGNFDTSDLPFSFIDVEGSSSVVTPAMNLFTVGTRRDSTKWPARDRRKDPEKLDLISFNLFNPYIIGKVVRGTTKLRDLYENTPREKEDVAYNGIKIKRLMLRTSCKYYEMAIKIYIGSCVLARLKGLSATDSWQNVLDRLGADGNEGTSDWVDLAGMLASKDSVGKLIGSIENGRIAEVASLQSALAGIHADYDRQEWNWCAALIEERLGFKMQDITPSRSSNLWTTGRRTRLS